MYSKDLFKQIAFSMWSHKARTIAALFGIVWGTITVILLLAIGDGYYKKSMEDLSFLNNGTIFGWGGYTSLSYKGVPLAQKINLRIKEVSQIVDNIPGVKDFSPMYRASVEIKSDVASIDTRIQGVSASHDEMMQIEHTKGSRFINPIDIQHKNRVIFIDDKLSKTLFKDDSPLEKTIYVQGIPFTVIGIQNPDPEKATHFAGENTGYIPYTSFLSIFGDQNMRLIFVTPEKPEYSARIKTNLKNLLALNLHFDPADDEAFNMPNLAEAQVFITWFFRVVKVFLLFCGVLTLSIGGLGTANMMFLIVTERTREVGLRISLGAKHSDIMKQFMLEALCLVGLGGLIGAIISGTVLLVLQNITLPEWLGVPHATFSSAFTTFIVITFVGLMAGYFPARRAANMEPVKALAFR